MRHNFFNLRHYICVITFPFHLVPGTIVSTPDGEKKFSADLRFGGKVEVRGVGGMRRILHNPGQRTRDYTLKPGDALYLDGQKVFEIPSDQ